MSTCCRSCRLRSGRVSCVLKYRYLTGLRRRQQACQRAVEAAVCDQHALGRVSCIVINNTLQVRACVDGSTDTPMSCHSCWLRSACGGGDCEHPGGAHTHVAIRRWGQSSIGSSTTRHTSSATQPFCPLTPHPYGTCAAVQLLQHNHSCFSSP